MEHVPVRSLRNGAKPLALSGTDWRMDHGGVHDQAHLPPQRLLALFALGLGAWTPLVAVFLLLR